MRETNSTVYLRLAKRQLLTAVAFLFSLISALTYILLLNPNPRPCSTVRVRPQFSVAELTIYSTVPGMVKAHCARDKGTINNANQSLIRSDFWLAKR